MQWEISFTQDKKLTLRSLDLKKDLRIIQRWRGQEISSSEKEDAGEHFSQHYLSRMTNPDSHYFAMEIDELLVAKIDCQRLETQELGKYIPARSNDITIDWLMAPAVSLVPGLYQSFWRSLLGYIFSFEMAGQVYAAPVIDDHVKGKLLREAGFRFLENTVMMTTAISLYRMNRMQFAAGYP